MVLLSLMCLFLLGATPLLSQDATDSSSVSSTNAVYDGDQLILSGHVVLDHSLGKMSAEEAALERQEGGKDFPFSLIHLKKEVLLSLKNHAELHCERADLDFVSLKGFLQAKEGEKVLYKDKLKKKKGDLPLEMTCRHIELGFSKKAAEDKKNLFEIETVLAQEDVTVHYASAFVLQADHALYRRENTQGQKGATREFQGILSAYPKENERCHLTHVGGDLIDADAVDLDMAHSKISMVRPTGHLAQAEKAKMRFSSDHLVWDQNKNSLELKGNIRVDEETLGTLTALEKLTLEQKDLQGKHLLKTIRTEGPATLSYFDPIEQQLHTLTSHGTLICDQEKLTTSIESPQLQGQTPLDKQIYYENKEAGVFANKAQIEYSAASAATFQPISLTLNGNVRLFSHDPQKPPRCSIADRLTYAFATSTLILSANAGKKVLFWDAGQGVCVSAQEVHITQDKETKEHTIKGVGKVQFSFSQEEANQLKLLFPHYQIPQGGS